MVSFFGVEDIFIKFAFLLDRIGVTDSFLDEISAYGNINGRSAILQKSLRPAFLKHLCMKIYVRRRKIVQRKVAYSRTW